MVPKYYMQRESRNFFLTWPDKKKTQIYQLEPCTDSSLVGFWCSYFSSYIQQKSWNSSYCWGTPLLPTTYPQKQQGSRLTYIKCELQDCNESLKIQRRSHLSPITTEWFQLCCKITLGIPTASKCRTDTDTEVSAPPWINASDNKPLNYQNLHLL